MILLAIAGYGFFIRNIRNDDVIEQPVRVQIELASTDCSTRTLPAWFHAQLGKALSTGMQSFSTIRFIVEGMPCAQRGTDT